MTHLIPIGTAASLCLLAIAGWYWLRHRSHQNSARRTRGWIRYFVSSHYGNVGELTISANHTHGSPILANFKNLLTGLRHRLTFHRTRGPSAAEFHSEWREDAIKPVADPLHNNDPAPSANTRSIDCRETAPVPTIRPQ